MSPYEIRILLHYFYSTEDFPDMYERERAPAWGETKDGLKREGLLSERAVGERGALYRLTDKGKCYVVDGLLCVPLPIATWKMPSMS